MAKGSSSLRNNKARSSKPYDASNSFVRKVTSQVTNLLPQPEWLTRWFSSSTSQQNVESDNDDDGVVEVQQPPSKRAKISLNKPFPANSFRVADEDLREQRRPAFNSPSPVRHAYPEAVAGPSGLSSSARFSSSATLQSTMVAENMESKLNVRSDLFAGDGGSDSSESTSGCSSLVPQASKLTGSETLAARRRSIDEKLSLTNHLQTPRSLFPNRTRTPRIVPPPSRRRPSFNSSVFSSPLEREKLPSKELSPFYSGRIMYGGASAYRRPMDTSFVNELNVSKRGIQVRPVNETKNSPEVSMSHTARRIMEALEQFSTPIQDAKRLAHSVPVYRPPLGSKRKCPDNDSQPPRPPPLPTPPLRSGPPTQSLNVPSVADLIKLRCKEKLQDSMESARRIASSSADPYSRKPEEKKVMKHRDTIFTTEKAEEVNLPEVPLPITTMPKFDIIVPPVSTAPSSVQSSSFKFSSPITVTSANPDIKSRGTFVFSPPVNKSVEETVTVGQNFLAKVPSSTGDESGLKMKEPKAMPKCKGQSASDEVCGIKPASELKTGSVMDYFKAQKKEEVGSKDTSVGFGDAFKPVEGTWECEVCMIRNKPKDTLCLACSNPRKSQVATPVVKSGNMWQCTFCLVSNNNSEVACVACATEKLGTVQGEKPKQVLVGSTWSCLACNTVNLASSSTCKDCWCNKPNNVPDSAKPKTEEVPSWICSVCLVRNEGSVAKCVSCQQAKVPSAPANSKVQFKFEIPTEASTFKFGIDKSGVAPATNSNLGGFKFGESTTTTTSMNFSFGVPSSTVAQGSNKPKDVVSSTASSQSSSTAIPKSDASKGFSFGNSQNQSSEVSDSSPSLKKKTPDIVISDSPINSVSEVGRKRKQNNAEPVVKEVVSSQKRKAESTGADKPVENEKPAAKPALPLFNSSDAVPKYFSSNLATSATANTKTTNNSGFSFVSSSTSVDKPVAGSAPSFVFGASSSKAIGPTVSSATAVPSFGSTVTSSSGFGSTTKAAPATTSTTFMFGAGTSKPIFGTGSTTTTTSISTTSSNTSTTTPVTTPPSFGVPDTTTPTFGSSAAKLNVTNSSVTASATPTFNVSSPAKASIFGGVTTTTTASSFGLSAPNFGGVSTTAAGSFTSASSPFGATNVTTTAASVTPAFGTSTSATPNFGLTSAGKIPTFGSTSTTTASVFGSIPATSSVFGSTTTTSAPTFGSATTTSAPVFGSTTTTSVSVFGSTTTTSTPVFGSTSTTSAPIFGSTPTTSTPVFGSTPATSVPVFGSTPTTSVPVFGSTSTTSTPIFGSTAITTAPVFGSAPTTLTSSFSGAPVATPSFGGTSTPSFGIPPTTTVQSFGNPAAPSFAASSTKSGGFGISTTKAPPAFGTSAVTPAFGTTSPSPGFVNFGSSAFGTPAAAATTATVGFGTPTVTPSFGTPKTDNSFPATGTPTPIFGATTTTSSFGSGFGTTSTPTPAFGGFSSGAGKTSAPGGFAFKGNPTASIFGGAQSTSNNSDCTPSKVPNFGFGAANTGTPNAAPVAATQNFDSFNFTSGSSAAPAFGANTGGANATGSSVFGSAATPTFGAAGTSSGFGSGGFNFSAGNAGSQPFSFTGAQPGQNPTPAFGQQPQAPLTTFNPNVRPSFDFTRGETPQFTAQSTPQGAPGRRIRRAVRRSHR